MPLKLETFTAEPPCAGCTRLLELADKIDKKYKDKVKLIRHISPCKEFEKYELMVIPAVVLNEGKIKIMGVCPSVRTLEASLKEMGV